MHTKKDHMVFNLCFCFFLDGVLCFNMWRFKVGMLFENMQPNASVRQNLQDSLIFGRLLNQMHKLQN